MPIDASKIDPALLYSTDEAAKLIAAKSADAFRRMMKYHGYGPAIPNVRPLRWLGADLWKLLNHEPRPLTQKEHRAIVDGATMRIFETRFGDRAKEMMRRHKRTSNVKGR